MKLFAFLVAAGLTAGMPHGPDEGSMAPAKAPPKQPTGVPAPKAAPEAAPKVAAPQVAPPQAAAPLAAKAGPGQTTTPAGCRKLATDVDWPSEGDWKQVLPEITARSKTLAKGVYRPDYKVQAESIKDVQEAIKFCVKNNVRLTVINTGYAPQSPMIR
jgi:hypothetical protein